MIFLSIVPFYGQSEPGWDISTRLENKLPYLELTVESLTANDMLIGVQNKKDFEIVKSVAPDAYIIFFDTAKIEPKYLLYNTVNYVQQHVDDEFLQYEFFFYSDADQVLYMTDEIERNIIVNLRKNSDRLYVSPHRLEQVPRRQEGRRLIRFSSPEKQLVEFSGKKKESNNRYIFSNHLAIGEVMKVYKEDNKFYVCTDIHNAYGSSWICHRNLFKRIAFYPDNQQAGEAVGGKDIFLQPGNIGLKTVDSFSFFVDHLSGFDFNVSRL